LGGFGVESGGTAQSVGSRPLGANRPVELTATKPSFNVKLASASQCESAPLFKVHFVPENVATWIYSLVLL
jgi:hypothetical protein